jgi:cell division septal protein FtsQ
MTTAYNYSQNRQSTVKQGSENARLYLLMILLGLLTLFFVFWTPTEPGYEKQSFKGSEVTTNNKIEKADPATMYKTIVTNGDAIRSVLQ